MLPHQADDAQRASYTARVPGPQCANIAAYASHQIDCGAQVMQVFESWAHHLGPDDFDIFAKPYADKAMALIKEKHPDTPLIYFANGGSSFLERQADMKCDMLCVDWKVDMAKAR